MTRSEFCDALIIGGGPAGAALAFALAQARRDVVLLEKSREAHHKVCGEFLSPEAVPFLLRMGIDAKALGAQTIHSVRLAARDVIAEARLPQTAFSLTRRTLDEALLESARRAGAQVKRGCNVESLAKTADSWRARAANGESELQVDAREVFLATGKHDLRGWARDARGTQSGLVAMKTYFSLAPRQMEELAGHVEITLFPGGYVGLQAVEQGHSVLCGLVTREKLRRLGGSWDRLLDHMLTHSTHLARRLSGAAPMLEKPLALSSIPYGYCTPVPENGCAAWRVGDQAAVVPSFSGDGMAIAFHTAERAAELYLAGASAAAFQAEVQRRYRTRLGFATQISRLAIAAPFLARAVAMWPGVLAEIFRATRVPGSIVSARDLPPV